MHRRKHIDDMTNKWLSQTPNPPRENTQTYTGRPIIAVCDDPTARMSYFVETLLQPIAQLQQSYIRDTTAFFNFLERTKISKDSIVVSIGVSSLIVHKYTSRRRNEYSMRSILKSPTTISHRSQRTTSGQCLA